MRKLKFELLVITFLYVCITTGCKSKKPIQQTAVQTETQVTKLMVLGFDKSKSVSEYRLQDTNFVGSVCRNNENGGLVVVYGIGNPTDLSGLRCYLKPIPKVDRSLTLSKQAEQTHIVNSVKVENEKAIQLLLVQVQRQIFDAIDRPEGRTVNTDLNGFFKKVSVLINEPQCKVMKQFIFCYSDGIQSVFNEDGPARFIVNSGSDFTLCLVGWKTRPPCESISIEYFEDPQGFLRYIKSNLN